MFGGTIRCHIFFFTTQTCPHTIIPSPLFRLHLYGPFHCPQCHNALRVLEPTIGGIHGPGGCIFFLFRFPFYQRCILDTTTTPLSANARGWFLNSFTPRTAATPISMAPRPTPPESEGEGSGKWRVRVQDAFRRVLDIWSFFPLLY